MRLGSHGSQSVPHDTTRISILIVADETALFLGDAVASALAQDRRADEIVVVHAGADDAPAALFASGEVPGVGYLRAGGTGPEAWNEGLAAVTGDIVVLLGPDELLAHDATTQHLLAFTDEPDGDVCLGAVARVDDGFELVDVVEWPTDRSEAAAWAVVVDGATTPVGSMAVRRSAVARIGGLDSALGSAAHIELVLRSMVVGTALTTAAPTVLQRTTHRPAHPPEIVARLVRIVAEAFPIGSILNGEVEGAIAVGLELARLGDLDGALVAFELLADIAPSDQAQALIDAVTAGLHDPQVATIEPVELSDPPGIAVVDLRSEPPRDRHLEAGEAVVAGSTSTAPSAASRHARISVGLVSGGSSAALIDAVRSLEVQTSPPDDVLVIVDGSVDMVDTAGLPHVRTVRSSASTPAGHRNAVVHEANGDYVLILSPGDLLEPWTIEAVRRLLAENPEVDVVTGDTVLCDERLVPLRRHPAPDVSGGPDTLVPGLFAGASIVDGSAVFRRSTVIEAGGYDERFSSDHDHELVGRLAGSALFGSSDIVVLRRRGSTDTDDRALRAQVTVARDLLDRHGLSAVVPHGAGDVDAGDAAAVSCVQAAVRLVALGDLHGALDLLRSDDIVIASPQGAELVATISAALADGVAVIQPLEPASTLTHPPRL